MQIFHVDIIVVSCRIRGSGYNSSHWSLAAMISIYLNNIYVIII